MKELLEKWEAEYQDLKGKLYKAGEAGDSLQYNLLSTDALTLSSCIRDLQKALLTANKELK